ncbi:unnamed protein product [Cuscuta campestris]|uniref:Polygalacturonase n=1 Tax=Cuscuta campestris TaxID=132261 RepID=A0A484LEZ1_9ASTE|nr:unnamed protein product [Cuscuta campestris]
MAKNKLISPLIFTTIITAAIVTCVLAAGTTYNILSYGAVADGKTDANKAFQAAWNAACASGAPSVIVVPNGRFLVSSVTFEGSSCKSKSITFQMSGTLVAPQNYKLDKWISFHMANGLSIIGGTLDAQGAPLWACKKSGKGCGDGATALSIYHSNNVVVSGVSFVNSQKFNFLVYQCDNAKIQGVKITAPGDSPNTDGIHVEMSSRVTITNAVIGTGDDCISIGHGNSDLTIEGTKCGPGHGISIGSLGWTAQEAGVQNVVVRSSTFVKTQNGFRIKTWARPSSAFVSNVVFSGAVMDGVQNPILIDQDYCPHGTNCPNQSSGVKISNVKFQGIRGTSSSAVAVKLDCSRTKPCTGINLDNVNLMYNGREAQSSCVNAKGLESGLVKPAGCALA